MASGLLPPAVDVHRPNSSTNQYVFNLLPLRCSIFHFGFGIALLGLVLFPIVTLIILCNPKSYHPSLLYMLVLYAVADALFLYGLKTSKPRCMIPALIIAAFVVILRTIELLLFITAYAQGDSHAASSSNLVMAVQHAFALVVLVLYCLAYLKVRKGQVKLKQQQQMVGEPVVAYQKNGAVEIGGGKNINSLYPSIINYSEQQQQDIDEANFEKETKKEAGHE